MSKRDWIVIVAIIALCACAGCKKKGKPPTGGRYLDTGYGKVRLVNNECGHVDEAALVLWSKRGYERAASVNADSGRVRLDGMVYVMKRDLGGNVGEYHPSWDTVYAKCGVERVVEHEIHHRQCYRLRLPCCLWVDHRAHPEGRDMNCRAY